MRKIGLIAATGFALVSFAQAKDFDGFYAGLQAGASATNVDFDTNACTPVCGLGVNEFGGYDLDNGLSGGVFAGYSVNLGAIIVGAEADINLESAEGSGRGSFMAYHQTDTNWTGALRARVGFEVAPSLLAYGAAGVAFGSVSHAAGQVAAPPSIAMRYDNDVSGITYGAGLEMNLGDGLSARVEYRRTDFDGDRVTQTVLLGTPLYDKAEVSSDKLSIGVSMYF
jgi:outer membrane immunogenic protein